MMSLDDIIVTKSARELLEKHQILPSQWNLPDGEAEKIIEAGVKLAVMFSPASQLKLPKGDYDNLVIIDVSFLGQKVISPEIQVSIILHEIGHIVNPPQPCTNPNYMDAMNYGDKFDDELCADLYAARCGYGEAFASALKLMRQRAIHGFESESVAERINRLNQASSKTESV
jgi:hypothetical protein